MNNSSGKVERSALFKAGLLISMYMGQTVSLGYVFGSLPVIMRQQNMPLKAIGALFLLPLPWAFKFLWARWVDDKYIAALGRRRSWIFPLQWLGAVILLALSRTPPETHFVTMYLLVLLLHIVMATNDIAVDGYATDILHPHERPWGNTIQSGARFAGLMLGGGLMLFLHSSLGWQNLCLILALALFLFSLPVVFHHEISPISSSGSHNKSNTGVLAFIRRREVIRLLPILILPTTFVFTSFQMHPPLLTDLGLTTKNIGELLMNWAYPVGLLGTILSGWLLKRSEEKLFLRIFCITAVVVNCYTVQSSFAGTISLTGAAVILSVDNVLMGSIHVWAYTRMMEVSAGRQAGMGFAVLSSLFIIFPLISAPAFGALGDQFGFTTLYMSLVLLMISGFFLAERIQYYKPATNPIMTPGKIK
jgi:MFS family permease